MLWFYGKNKKLTGQVYIVALAVIDLVACGLMLPQQPLFELRADLKSPVFKYLFTVQGAIQLVAYFGVQVTMALDQFIAVFWPFKHARLQRILNSAMLAIFKVHSEVFRSGSVPAACRLPVGRLKATR